MSDLPLKGQCHEMNNFLEGLKNQISTLCIGAVGFNSFASSISRKVLSKFLLTSMKTLTNYGNFTGIRIRIPPHPPPPPPTRLVATQTQFSL
jgi:hypothetical protein